MRHSVRRRSVRSVLSVLALTSLAACNGDGTLDVEATRSALTLLPGDFPADAPTFMVNQGNSKMDVRVSGSAAPTTIVTYGHSYGAGAGAQYPEWTGPTDEVTQSGTGPAPTTNWRPLAFWDSHGDTADFTALYNDANNGDVTMDAHHGTRVEPLFGAPLGPPAALDELKLNGASCAFGIYNYNGSNTIEQSCIAAADASNVWSDWGLELPPNLVPSASPLPFRRSPNSDGVSYPCGSGTTVCEYRVGGRGSQNVFSPNFGAGAFMTNTRPTAISGNPNAVNGGTPLPWAFAAVLNGSSRSVIALHETSGIDCIPGTGCPAYATTTVETTMENVAYSTPMPYSRSDLTVGVVYFRTLSGSTTRIYDAHLSGSTWTSQQIYDTGIVLPAGAIPVPFADSIAQGADNEPDVTRDSVAYRQPGSVASDVVLLRRGPVETDGFTKVVLPPPIESSGLNYVAAPMTFEDASWNGATFVTAAPVQSPDTTVGPSGGAAEVIKEATGTSTHGIIENLQADGTVPYRWTIYLRSDGRSAAKLTLSSSNDPASSVSAFVDLGVGVVSSTSTLGTGTYLGSTCESVGNGWYRVSLVGKPSSSAGNFLSISLNLLSVVNGSTTYSGDASKGFYAWGAEFSVYGAGFEGAAAPTNLTATPGNAQVTLSWTASEGATSYDLYRATSAGGESGTPVKTGITTTSYVDPSLTNGTKYYYKVAAVAAGGPGPSSSEVSATPAPSVPAAPTNLAAAAGNAQVSLTWTGSSGATSYNVYRGTSAGGESGTPVKTGITTTSYVDPSLTNGTKYYYKVAAVSSSGTSPMSNEASVTPVAITQIDSGTTSPASGWVADTGTGGSDKSWTTQTVNTTLLTGAIPAQLVLQTALIGKTLTYTFSGLAANSSHSFAIYSVENYWTKSAQRVFNVIANGTVKLSGVDVFALAGAQYKAIQKSFTASADSMGKIVLTLQGTTDNATIAGLVVQ
jgi:fibronectin type III domain protein/malectin (di-glucose binding ER protein)